MIPRIAVIDYGAGNLRSIGRALAAAGAEPVVTIEPETVAAADGIVLPGVGAAGASMDYMRDHGLIDPVLDAVANGTPFLGVCLGMQLLFEDQEEGNDRGLGVLQGRVRSLKPGPKIPQIGWNQVHLVQDSVLGKTGDTDDFYFVHSFVCDAGNPDDVVALTRYDEVFPATVMHDAVWGVQFHPEKSGEAGLKLIGAWLDLVRKRTARPLQAAVR